MHRMIIEVSERVQASPEAVYAFFEGMDDDRYRGWHPDHIAFDWVEGDGVAEGNVAYFEEKIGDEVKEQTVRYRTVTPGRYLEMQPISRLIRLVLPSISFSIEPTDDGCRVTQRLKIRTGPIGRRVNRAEFAAIRQHMEEEAENLRDIVEEGATPLDTDPSG